MIEAVIDLDGVEMFRVELKHLRGFRSGGVEHIVKPVFVMPTRRTDMNPHHLMDRSAPETCATDPTPLPTHA